MPSTRDLKVKGLSIRLDGDGDLVATKDDEGNIVDLELVEGIEEVEQSVRILLSTRLGEDRLHPTIGLPLDLMIRVSDPAFTAGTVARSLQEERRVARVVSVAEMEHGSLPDRIHAVQLVLGLVDGRGLTMEAYLGAGTGVPT